MPRPDPIPAVTAAMTATVWGLATLATLLAADPAVIAWNPRPPCSLTGVLEGVVALLEPVSLLTGLILVLAGAALARTGRLGARARCRAPGVFRAACVLLKAGLAATAVALLLKAVIGRARPAADPHGWLTFDPFTVEAAFQSAPSAHAALAGALVAAAARQWPRGTWIWVAFGLLAGGMRILSGEHWPSDVIAGLGLGAMIGLWATGRPAPIDRERPLTALGRRAVTR